MEIDYVYKHIHRHTHIPCFTFIWFHCGTTYFCCSYHTMLLSTFKNDMNFIKYIIQTNPHEMNIKRLIGIYKKVRILCNEKIYTHTNISPYLLSSFFSIHFVACFIRFDFFFFVVVKIHSNLDYSFVRLMQILSRFRIVRIKCSKYNHIIYQWLEM